MFDTLWYSTRLGQYAYFDGGKLWQTDAIGTGTVIYRAKVVRQAPALAGVFADVGGRQVLISYGKAPLPEVGEAVYVYEAEPAMGTKLAVCKPNPVVAGQYVLYYPTQTGLRYAKALSADVRAMCAGAFPEGAGCLVRSKVTADTVSEAVAEWHALDAAWRQKTAYVGVGQVYQCEVDCERMFGMARSVLSDDRALALKYGLTFDEGLSERFERIVGPETAALGKRVQTAEGVELVIEKTEACWVIDVNGKGVALDQPAANAACSVNRIAAGEVLRQICLRNLTGVILVDFVSMPDRYNRPLLDLLRATAEIDARTHVVDVTALGIVELTRCNEQRS